MASTPLFSLIMITYNKVQFLKAAIESVLAQTYENWELIISDDASTDGTWELAVALSADEPRIKLRRNPTNIYIPLNRAAAAEMCTGEYIGHIDGDDVLYYNAVELAVYYFHKYPDVALVFSDTSWLSAKGEIYGYHKNPDYCEDLSKHGWKHFGAFKREKFLEVGGYNTEITKPCEDGNLFMKLAEKYKFFRMPYVLYSQRHHGENQSSQVNKCNVCDDRMKCDYIRVWAKWVETDDRYIDVKTMSWIKKDASPSDIRTSGDGKDDGAASTSEAHAGDGGTGGADSVRVVHEGGSVGGVVPAGA